MRNQTLYNMEKEANVIQSQIDNGDQISQQLTARLNYLKKEVPATSFTYNAIDSTGRIKVLCKLTVIPVDCNT